MSAPRILLFDSGMGGLTVARAVRADLPNAELLYSADNAAFPYGAWDEPALVQRIVKARRVKRLGYDDLLRLGARLSAARALGAAGSASLAGRSIASPVSGD